MIFFQFFIFIEFIGVALVSKIIQVSVVQLHNTSSVYCTVQSPPQFTSSSVTIYFPRYSSSTSLHSPSLW